jgi:hypothetical protein
VPSNSRSTCFEISVKIRSADADPTRPDPYSWQLAPVDPIVDRLLVHFQDAGDLGNRQELVVNT